MSVRDDFLYRSLGMEALNTQLLEDEARWSKHFATDARGFLTALKHGDLDKWIAIIQQLPEVSESQLSLDQDVVSLNSHQQPGITTHQQLLKCLQALKPWRKGPYQVFGINIDTEWHSDHKWNRIKSHFDLEGKTVLDVGCANGYFGWRMLGAGARSVVGIDPGWLFIMQFLLIRHYAPAAIQRRHTILPYRLEDLPPRLDYFDSVFSMGVLYHRRSVFDHLFELKQCLKPGGELILETLVIAEEDGEVLVPADRYAKMRNVWFLPNSHILSNWLTRAGFENIRIIDESITSLDEQRKTPWMDSQSLEHALDPADPSRTVEGYPAPRRATLMARRPVHRMA